MKKVMVWLCIICIFSVMGGSFDIKAEEKPDTIQTILEEYGYDINEIKYDPEILSSLIATNAKMTFPWFHRWWSHPFEIPKNVKGTVSGIAGSYQDNPNFPDKAEYKNIGLFNQFAGGMSRTGYAATLMPELKLMPYPIDKEEPILDGVKFIYAAMGYDFYEPQAEAVRTAVGGMPAELQMPIADYLYSAVILWRYRNRAMRNIPKEKWADVYDKAIQMSISVEETKDLDAFMWDTGPAFDYFDLYNGTVPLIYSILKIEKKIRDEKFATSGHQFDIYTPLGRIAFQGGSEKNEYIGDDYCLIVDCMGDDNYLGATAANSSLNKPVSVVIDFEGNDCYCSDKRDKCSQAAGVLGVGILIDEQGNDLYEAWDNAQGVATFGVGLLWDHKGDDTFKARVFSQGAAQFGVANLVNIGGNDTYYAFYASQAYGYTGGYGLLLDTEGDDQYTAEPTELLTPGVLGHNDNVNYSLCQGVGFGRRADLYDGHSMGGGMGVLCDLKGNDKYVAGIYAQSSAYWYATGILYDKEGNDVYDAYFFVQSGTAHMGITELLDEAGDDIYYARQAISAGGAHDVSISWHIDKGGNDKFICHYEVTDKDGKKTKTSGGILLGSSTANGMGILVNIGGDDVYDVLDEPGRGKQSVGYANHVVPPTMNTWRNTFPDVGLFIDIGGNDTYTRPDLIKNNISWKQESTQYARRMSVGIGLDIEDGYVPWIEW